MDTSVCNLIAESCLPIAQWTHLYYVVPPQSAEQRSLVLALAAHLRPMQHAPVTQRKAALAFYGIATASKPPAASSWRPMPRQTGGTPRRCCGHAYREWGRMRKRRATALESSTVRRQAVCQQQPASRPVRCWHWSVTGSPNCVSARPQPRHARWETRGRLRRRGGARGLDSSDS